MQYQLKVIVALLRNKILQGKRMKCNKVEDIALCVLSLEFVIL